ncbi:DUF885 domain-containing protein [Rhizosaccharibacter radicis]|uniref:DUF885 domain-containing protein n=1 Tax=Rhizosaccharibacter radicis TaxID=2782605 RepID=A0ABT1VXC5_9PROT|nr:DUF885 domain-containing protein [Acetobacteraceae bacterium KSS12]
MTATSFRTLLLSRAFLAGAFLAGAVPASRAAVARSLDDIAIAHFQGDWAAGPVAASQLGVHGGDGKLDDTSLAAIQADARRLHAERDELAALDVSRLKPRDRDDRDVLVAAIDKELLLEERIQPFRHDPDAYVSLATNGVYVLIDRDYAPLPDRMRAAISREEQIPGMLALAQVQLTHVPSVFRDIAREDLQGAVGFLSHDVPQAFAAVSDKALQDRLATSTRTAVASLQRFNRWLDAITPDGSFVLGADGMRAFLAADMVDVPLDKVIAAGRAQLAKDKAAYLEVEKQVDPAKPGAAMAQVQTDHPPADKLVSTAQGQLKGLQQFILSHKLVDLPSRDLPEVRDTPPFQRALITAAMDWPGALETKALKSFYYVTPPPTGADAAKTEQYLQDFNLPLLQNITVHEAMPGHFVQGLYLRAHPEWSLIRKTAASYATTEGWAHYVEQMTLDQGLNANDPKYRLAQLQDALLRDCRFVDAFAMHTQNMSLADATRLMQTECFQSPMSAFKEARRGTEDPGYFSYTLGKLMILHLRDDMQAKHGKRFSLEKFHDALLGAGLVPMKIIRREMSGSDGPLL